MVDRSFVCLFSLQVLAAWLTVLSESGQAGASCLLSAIHALPALCASSTDTPTTTPATTTTSTTTATQALPKGLLFTLPVVELFTAALRSAEQVMAGGVATSTIPSQASATSADSATLQVGGL